MIWIIIILGIAADYLSKRWALANLTGGSGIELIPGYLDFTYVENRGAAFGIFQGQIRILGFISIIMGTALLIYLLRSKTQHPLMKVSLSFIVAGAFGNAYDRFVYDFVVDFIHFHLQDTWHFAVFNVADMLVVVGSGLMILYTLFIDGKAAKASE